MTGPEDAHLSLMKWRCRNAARTGAQARTTETSRQRHDQPSEGQGRGTAGTGSKKLFALDSLPRGEKLAQPENKVTIVTLSAMSSLYLGDVVAAAAQAEPEPRWGGMLADQSAARRVGIARPAKEHLPCLELAMARLGRAAALALP